MFAIKVIEENGSEYVRPDVEGVRFNPPMTVMNKASLFVWYKNASQETLLSGDAYVMNENGKTVAVYHMCSMEPMAR